MAMDTYARNLASAALKKASSGGGGSSDYSKLANKPSINNIELVGNKSAEDLGIYGNVFTFTTNPTDKSNYDTWQTIIDFIEAGGKNVIVCYAQRSVNGSVAVFESKYNQQYDFRFCTQEYNYREPTVNFKYHRVNPYNYFYRVEVDENNKVTEVFKFSNEGRSVISYLSASYKPGGDVESEIYIPLWDGSPANKRYVDTNGVYIVTGTNDAPFVFEGQPVGTYIILNGANDSFYYKAFKNGDQIQYFNKDLPYGKFYITNTLRKNTPADTVIFTTNTFDNFDGVIGYKYDATSKTFTAQSYVGTNKAHMPVLQSGNETIDGIKTFTSLPQSAVVPTGDDELVNKKYVDSHTPTVDLSNYLAKNNTEEYTPTGAYNPATKDYVDKLFAQYTTSINEKLAKLTTPANYNAELAELTNVGSGE